MAQNDKSKLAGFLDVDASALQAPVKSDPSVIYQTNEKYDPRIDLRPDQVIVHQHGRPMDTVTEGIKSWQDQGHDVIRMFFASSDANQDFEQGRADGTAHTDAQETEANGNVLRCGGERAYTFPTAEWKAYCKTFIDHALENGVVGISPEEPFAHGTAGYSEAYKRTFAEEMGKPWVAPYASPAAYWEACQFKSNQFYRLVDEFSTYLKAQAAEQGKDVRYILPIHSILSNMAGGRIFSNVRSIGIENVDAWIAQVWTGPVNWAMGDLAGKRYDGFFESALALYSTFAELCRDVEGRDMYFLVDPVEDDPDFSWDTYRARYEMCVAAMLQYPWVDHYEVMPWPDRIFLPGFSMGGGTPGPADYLTELMAVLAVESDMVNVEGEPSANDQGLGLFISDSASWEIHGPQSVGFGAFHGLYLPFASQGIAVRTPWLERADDPDYLDDYKVLMLSYDNQKPATEAIHDGLLEWVRRGGQLVLIGGQSAYNDVEGWWKAAGFDTPLLALLDKAGVKVNGTKVIESDHLKLRDSQGRIRPIAGSVEALAFDVAEGAQAMVNAAGNERVGLYTSLGKGGLTVVGTPADWASDDEKGRQFICAVVEDAALRAGQALEPSNVTSIKRGPYVAGYVREGEHAFAGTFVDVFDPMYPLVKDPVKGARKSVLLKEVDATRGESPKLLFASHKLIYSNATPDRLDMVLEGPSETLAAVRVLSPADRHRPLSATAIDAAGNAVPVLHKYDPDSASTLVQFPYSPEGVAVRLTWKEDWFR